MDNTVYALAVDGSGNLYAGGWFTTAGGVNASSIAKWNGTSWSALGEGTDDVVDALAVGGSGNLYAGGDFRMAGVRTSYRIAELPAACAEAVDVELPGPTKDPFEFATPWPNPAVRAIHLQFTLPEDGYTRADVFDVTGRRIASPIDGQHLSAGVHRVTWDGRDASGRRVPAGVYEVRVSAGSVAGVRRVVMLK
jgi:hypothetical protein